MEAGVLHNTYHVIYFVDLTPRYNERPGARHLPNERSNRAAAENRPEETRGGRIVARWKVVQRKTDKAMVRFARERVLRNLTQRAEKMGMKLVALERLA